MPKTPKTHISVDEIAAKATRGADVCAHFTNRFTVAQPVRRKPATAPNKKSAGNP